MGKKTKPVDFAEGQRLGIVGKIGKPKKFTGHPSIKSVTCLSGVSAIIADIRKHYGNEWAGMREEILHAFHIAKTCESHSMMMVFLIPGREQLELKIRYLNSEFNEPFDNPYFETTLAGLPIREKELRELVG